MRASPATFRPASPSPLAEPSPSHKNHGNPPVTCSSPQSPWTEGSDFDSPGCSGSESDDARDDRHMPSTLLHKLSKFPLFKDAPKSFHARIAAKLHLVHYHPREFIIKEGDPALSMYWILKGSVSVASTDGESVYAELKSGSFFGEIGILYNRPRTATVVACQRVLVGMLTSDALNSVLRAYPLVERRIRDEAQERLAMHDKKNKADIPIVQRSKSPGPTGLRPAFPLQDPGVSVSAASSHTPLPSPLSQLVSSSRESVSSADNVDQTVSIQEFIKSVPIFKNLPSQIIHRLALEVEPIGFKPFEYIFKKDDPGSDIYFITHGEVEVVDVNSSSNIERVLARLRTGSFFGEMAFLNYIHGNANPKRSASVRSVASVELVVMRTASIKDVYNQYSNVADEMRRTANERKNSNETPERDTLLFSAKTASTIESSRQSPPIPSPSPQPTPGGDPASGAPPDSFFVNPNWKFGGFEPKSQANTLVSRSVSPVSSLDVEPFSFAKPFLSPKSSNATKPTDTAAEIRQRVSVADLLDQQLPRGPFDMVVPPKNPVSSSNAFSSSSRRNSFQYMPHNKRVKLSHLAGRRRSSVLVSTGSIPDKVLLGAFEFLALPDLMRLRLVSRRWRQLLYVAGNLFKKLDLSPWNTVINDQALVHITDFVGSRPRYIDISNCFYITDEGFSYLVNEVGMAGNITVFKMRCLWEVSAMAIMDLTSPSVGKSLHEVDLSNCRKVQDSVVERLIGWSNNSSAAVLHLPGSEGTFNNEAGSKCLRVLKLGYCKHLTDNIMYHISFHANERLEYLDLTRCTTITDAGFQHWTYRSFPNLKKLSLKDCTYLSDRAIISLANAAPYLEILNLNFCCALSDLAIEALCQGCVNLRELDLSFCGSAVSDSSLAAISLYLARLEKIIVKGCVRVTRAGVDALLSGNAPLTFIDVSQCRNAHQYPGGIPAQAFQVNASTKSAFVNTGTTSRIVELVI